MRGVSLLILAATVCWRAQGGGRSVDGAAVGRKRGAHRAAQLQKLGEILRYLVIMRHFKLTRQFKINIMVVELKISHREGHK